MLAQEMPDFEAGPCLTSQNLTGKKFLAMI
jgi:hypothetical protein